MDFFQYANFASYFVNTLWVQLLVGGLCFAIVYVFQAVALFTIATNNGYKNKWMAFIPFFNTYYIGVCAQKTKLYNIDTKKIGIAAAVMEAVVFALFIVYYAARLVIIYNGCEVPVTITTAFGYTYEDYQLIDDIPQNLLWAAWMYDYMGYIVDVFDLLLIILQVCLLICFFQTYASRRYVLFTVTSIIFPIQGILFFVVRNNKGVNYRDFLRAEQARQYAAYQQYQQQFHQNPYNQNPYNRNPYNQNPYNQNPYNNPGQSYSQTKPDDPFADLGGDSGSGNSNGGSPFDDFN